MSSNQKSRWGALSNSNLQLEISYEIACGLGELFEFLFNCIQLNHLCFPYLKPYLYF